MPPTNDLSNIGEGEAITDAKRMAVLVLDFQNEFVSPGGKLHFSVKHMMEKTGVATNLPKFIAAAREGGAIIIHSPVILPKGSKMKPGDWDPQYDADIEDLFTEGTWNSEFAGEIQQEEGDIILTNRSSFDAFVGTGLEKLLEENNVGYLFVGGFLSNLCVEESIYSADEIEGLETYTLTDGCAAKSEEEHFVATTGTFPFFSTPVTCHHAEMIVRDLAAGKMVSSSKVTDFMGEGSDGRASNTRSNRESMMRRNSAGDRRQTFLHQARFSAYMKHSERNRVTQKNRMSIATMLNYYPEKEEPDEVGFDPAAPIFMMVGSQRSGSNWLRTMLSEREDLAGPHPPHILRDFFPILDKFGDLEDEDNLEILVDHVCTFVENNQVAWLDKHGRKVKFDRARILDVAISTVDIMRTVHKEKDINQKYYLISVFDEIYNINAIACDKRTWICKSMGNSKFHDMLLTFYGEERLRYVYLVRDPRDVSLSFMNTPVGDCHYYDIVSKWTKLQRHALHVLSVSKDLVHQVRYEALLKSNEETMKGVNDFMGKRKMGKVLRRGSVAILKKVEDMMSGATKGTGSQQAAVLSYQFKNLTRGESFRKVQFEKWRTQMDDEDILLIESVAHEMMTRLGYRLHVVGVTRDALTFTEEQIAEFKVLNIEGIKKMNADLAVENPEDLKRRLVQKSVLEREAVLLSKAGEHEDMDIDEEDEDDDDDKIKKMYPYKWPKGANKLGYLSVAQVTERLQVKEKLTVKAGKFNIEYSVAMQRGYYPSDLDKPCQDSFLEGDFGGVQWLCVFDGHGPTGHDCANFARDNVLKNYHGTAPAQYNLGAALHKVNTKLHESSIDDSNSGSTALTVLIKGSNLLIANIGDCRCVIVSTVDGKLSARALTNDQTPHRKDERERIKKAGGLVMTSEQYDGDEPMHEQWVNGDSPPRIWSPEREKGKFPGCAFTRSIGDKNGEDVGVTADAEFSEYSLLDEDQMIIIGSDGIFEFISDIEVANISSIYGNPTEACRALIGESYKRWIKREERTDDITVFVGFISKED